MFALREIHKITSNTVTIRVPKAFQNHSVEIIMLPLNETPLPIKTQKTNWRDTLARATQLRLKIAARRSNKPLTPAVEMIRQTRDERNESFEHLR